MRIRSMPVTAALVLFMSVLAVGNSDGGLSSNMIEDIRNAFEMDVHTRSMYNALTGTSINDIALNRDIVQKHNDVFSHKIKAKGITNQKSSGRCWLFAGLNVMRPSVIEKHKLSNFEFSQNYLAFWDKMEKANCFLEQIIELRDKDPLDREMIILLRSPWGDGGWWKYVVDLIEKYGVVPKDVMPETASSGSTGMMNKLVSRKLRSDAVRLRNLYGDGKSVEELRAEKEKMLREVYRMLVVNLGEPPTEFPFRFEDRDSNVSEMKVYTPQEFYADFVGVDLSEYVNLFNDPGKEYGRHYRMLMSRNMYDREDVSYANVDIRELKIAAMKSVLEDEPVWFSCDVGKDQSGEHGIMAMDIYDYGSVYQTDMTLSKAERALYRESAPNHAMVFVGVDVKDDDPVKWLVENSWGTSRGDKGYWTLYDTWFDNHVYNVIVQRKYVPKDILSIYEQDPIDVPPWDPMYDFFR